MPSLHRPQTVASAVILLGLLVVAIPTTAGADHYASVGSPHCGPSGAACENGQVRMWRHGPGGPNSNSFANSILGGAPAGSPSDSIWGGAPAIGQTFPGVLP